MKSPYSGAAADLESVRPVVARKGKSSLLASAALDSMGVEADIRGTTADSRAVAGLRDHALLKLLT